MRITKHGHACVRVQGDGGVVVIDPGVFTDASALDGADAVLITHEHADHVHPDHLRSRDVIHSFFVPQLRLKQDAVPGREIPVWFEATKNGKYEVPCAELCGFGHSGMKGYLFVDTPADYATWAEQNKVGPAGIQG